MYNIHKLFFYKQGGETQLCAGNAIPTTPYSQEKCHMQEKREAVNSQKMGPK